MTDTTERRTKRRTKRRYASELFPIAAEDAILPLSTEVPRLYAAAVGHEVWGTGWGAAFKTEDRSRIREAADRISQLVYTRQVAFLADALAQGLTGDAAWTWAEERLGDESGEIAYERAVHYGVDPTRIKPYPCGPEPIDHAHYSNGTHGIVTTIPLRESECADCTEPIDTPTEPSA